MAPSLSDVIKIEDAYCGLSGRPSLGEAYAMLSERWAAGHRDRETALHLLFLNWFAIAEPNSLTGLPEIVRADPDPQSILKVLQGSKGQDLELDFVLWIMTEVCPWGLGGDESFWVDLGAALKPQSASSLPSVETFQDRGAYGHYFAHQLSGCIRALAREANQ